MTEPLLVLWDIDGTLIDNGGVGKRVHARAFELLTGIQPTQRVITDGMTDVAILRSMVERHQLEFSADLVTNAPEAMAEAMRSFEHELPQFGRALPGARSAIEALAATPGVIQTLLTGNVAYNAVAKLAAFGLDPHLDFEVGGFGADSEIRSDLVAVAQAKALAKYGVSFSRANTVIIGDTPRDIEAAHLGGARVVAVVSAVFSAEELLALGPDAVLPDLTDTGRFLDAVWL